VAGHRMMDTDECVRQLMKHQTVLRALVENGDLDAAVPACPDWDLRGLAHHLGEVHRWVAVAIAEGHPNAPTPVGPRPRGALLRWLDEGFVQMFDLLYDTDPDEPCWTFGPKPRTTRFWYRRQAHEHAIHAWDARASQASRRKGGARPAPDLDAGFDTDFDRDFDTALAVDGIDEVVGLMFPRQVRLGRIPALRRSLAILPTDGVADESWVLAGDGLPGPRPAPEATVTGPAAALYLLLWGRVTMDESRLSVDGDREIADSVLSAGIVP
jgi:uncharacterized protein (TIGR03083 family)